MKTFRRFYGEILEQVGLDTGSSPIMGGGSPAQKNLARARIRQLAAEKAAISERERIARKAGTIKEQKTLSPAAERLKARRMAASERTADTLARPGLESQRRQEILNIIRSQK